MKIKTAVFLKSATHHIHYPKEDLPEIAFIGRSNVGKSSLINTLVHRKKFARTSSTPGKTRTINFYEINGEFRFVDLPGYGFAKVSKRMRKEWKEMVEMYVRKRNNIKGVIVVLDARRKPDELDELLYEWLGEEGFIYITVVTKVDKLSRNGLSRQVVVIKMSLHIDELITFSAVTKEGRNRLWGEIRRFLCANSS
jgi:GTP-binding protein